MVLRNFIRLLRKNRDVQNLYAALRSSYPTLSLESNVQFKGPLENFSIGENSSIQSNCVLHLGGMVWCHNQGKIQIGSNCFLSPFTVLYGTSEGGIVIGDHFDCGPGVKILASKTNIENIENRDFADVIIGNNVTLYANVVISPGVTLGDNVVIGANSVVTSNIPSHTLAIGNPATVVKENIRP